MKKMGKLFACFLVSLLISLTVLSFVSAADSNIPSPGQVATSAGNGISNWWNSSGSFLSNLLNFSSLGFAKILIFFLVTLIVFGVAEFIPFMSGSLRLRWAISIVIALLATLYLNSSDVYTILISYSALGITLTAIIPFIIISIIAKKEHEQGRAFTSKILWLAFIVVLIMKVIASWSKIGSPEQWIYIIVLVLALIMFIWEKRLYFFLFKEQVKSLRESSNTQELAELTARLAMMREEIYNAPSEAIADPLKAKYNRVARRQRELGGNARDF